jgi:hypothetical protein
MIFLFILLAVLVAAATHSYWLPKLRALLAGLNKPPANPYRKPEPAPVPMPTAPTLGGVVKPQDFWVVRWWGRVGEYSSDMRPEMAVFTSEDDAIRFKGMLEDAFRLIRHTSGNVVKMEKGK